jgi:F-box and WD-40 domain protein CDC4
MRKRKSGSPDKLDEDVIATPKSARVSSQVDKIESINESTVKPRLRSLDRKDHVAPEKTEIQNLLLKAIQNNDQETLRMVSSILDSVRKEDYINRLPFELFDHIMGCLDLKSLTACSQVSKHWYQIIRTSIAPWRRLLEQHGWLDRFNRDYKNADDILPAYKGTISPGQEYESQYRKAFREYLLEKDKWYNSEPQKLDIPAHGNRVVTDMRVVGRKIFSSSDDETVQVHDLISGNLEQTFEGHDGGVWCFEVCGPGNNTLVTGSTDRTIRVWDVSTGKMIQKFNGHTGTIRCLMIVPKAEYQIFAEEAEEFAANNAPTLDTEEYWVLTGARDNTIKAWDLKFAPKPDNTMRFTPATSQHDSSSDEGDMITENGNRETLNSENDVGTVPSVESNSMNDISSESEVFTLSGHTGSVRALACEAGIVVSGSYDCTVRVWSLYSRKCLLVLSGHAHKVYSVQYDHKSRRIYSGSNDHDIRVWSRDTGECLAVLKGHHSLVGLLKVWQLNLPPQYPDTSKYRPYGSKKEQKIASTPILISAAADCSVKLWNLKTNEIMCTLIGQMAPISCMAVHENLLVTGSENHVLLWDLNTGALIRELVTDITSAWKIHINENTCVCAVRSQESRLEILLF